MSPAGGTRSPAASSRGRGRGRGRGDRGRGGRWVGAAALLLYGPAREDESEEDED